MKYNEDATSHMLMVCDIYVCGIYTDFLTYKVGLDKGQAMKKPEMSLYTCITIQDPDSI